MSTPAPAEPSCESALEQIATTVRAWLLASRHANDVGVELKSAVVQLHMRSSVSFSFLRDFATHALSGKKVMLFVGTLDKRLLISVRLATAVCNGLFTAPPAVASAAQKASGSKRGRDTFEAVVSVESALPKRARHEKSAQTQAPSFREAKESLAAVLALRGASSERIVQSWMLSERKAGEWGFCFPGKSGECAAGEKKELSLPQCTSVLIAVRLSGGVAIDLRAVLRAVKNCSDGMLTIDEAPEGSRCDLPKHESECLHASSLLLFGCATSIPQS